MTDPRTPKSTPTVKADQRGLLPGQAMFRGDLAAGMQKSIDAQQKLLDTVADKADELKLEDDDQSLSH